MAVYVGKSIITPLELESQPFVIDAELVEKGRVQIVNVDSILGDVISDVIGRTVARPGLETAAGHPRGEAVGVMVTASSISTESLGIDRAPELTAPDDDGIF